MNISKISRCPFEKISSNEQQQIAETVQITRKLIKKRYQGSQKNLRGVHPKSHGCVNAIFKVNSDLDKDLQVGLFQEPGKQFDSKIRFSKAAPNVSPDIDFGQHGSHGMAIKLFDVGGSVLLEDNGAKNQDFLMINQSVFAFPNPGDYLELNKVLLKHNDDPRPFLVNIDELLKIMQNTPDTLTAAEKNKLRTAKILSDIRKTPVSHPLLIEYFGAAPFLFGENNVMRFVVKPKVTDNYLAEALSASMKGNHNGGHSEFKFSFMIQVRACADGLNIEDASAEWNEEIYSFREVAEIVISVPQAEFDSSEQSAACEALEFNPWHSLVEHRPIGGINRLRKDVYLASSELR